MDFIISNRLRKSIVLWFLAITLFGCQTNSKPSRTMTIEVEGQEPTTVQLPEGFDQDQFMSSLLDSLPDEIPASPRVSWKDTVTECHEKNNIEIPEELLDKANEGDAESQWQLAILVINKSSCDFSSEGIRWLKQAAHNGSIEAIGEMGYNHLYGSYGFEINHSLAEAWLKKGAEANDPLSHFNMVRLYRASEVGETPDDEAISKWLKSGLTLGQEEAGFEYGYRCLEGLTGESTSNCINYIDGAISHGYSLGAFLNDTLAGLELLMAPVEWPFRSDIFDAPNFEYLSYPQVVTRVASFILSSNENILVSDLVVGLALPQPDRNLSEKERLDYGFNLMFIAANLGDPTAQDVMSQISALNGEAEREKYWKKRLSNNNDPSLQ